MSMQEKRELLEKVTQVLSGNMDRGGISSYSIGGREVRYMKLSELQALKKELEAELASGRSRTTYVRFDKPV
jgi:hypothetical protein